VRVLRVAVCRQEVLLPAARVRAAQAVQVSAVRVLAARAAVAAATSHK